MKKATENQIGCDHYKSDYQPVELFAKLNLNAFQANVVKYVCRHKRKNGKQDLEKAVHYCELAEEFGVPTLGQTKANSGTIGIIKEIGRFCLENGLSTPEEEVVMSVVLNSWGFTIASLNNLISIHYGD